MEDGGGESRSRKRRASDLRGTRLDWALISHEYKRVHLEVKSLVLDVDRCTNIRGRIGHRDSHSVNHSVTSRLYRQIVAPTFLTVCLQRVLRRLRSRSSALWLSLMLGPMLDHALVMVYYLILLDGFRILVDDLWCVALSAPTYEARV